MGGKGTQRRVRPSNKAVTVPDSDTDKKINAIMAVKQGQNGNVLTTVQEVNFFYDDGMVLNMAYPQVIYNWNDKVAHIWPAPVKGKSKVTEKHLSELLPAISMQMGPAQYSILEEFKKNGG